MHGGCGGGVEARRRAVAARSTRLLLSQSKRSLNETNQGPRIHIVTLRSYAYTLLTNYRNHTERNCFRSLDQAAATKRKPSMASEEAIMKVLQMRKAFWLSHKE